MELIMVDPGTVVGPNYSSKPICIECLKPGKTHFFFTVVINNSLYSIQEVLFCNSIKLA